MHIAHIAVQRWMVMEMAKLDLVEREAVKDAIGFMNLHFLGHGENKSVLDSINEVPAIDAVPVVRCKDCKYWKPGDSKGGNSIEDLQVIGGCKWTNFCRREMDFCSFGERKDHETD